METANLLILMSDEHDPRIAGHEGHPLAKTPNIDRLAEEGTRFTAAYTPSPICVPARASFATGRWVHEIRYWDNAMGYTGAPEGWGHQLLSAGHRVDSIGKLHYRSPDDPTGFSEQYEPMHLMDNIGMIWGSIRDPLPERERGKVFHRIGAGVSNYNLYDRRTANSACQWLKDRASQTDDKPWVLYTGFVAPHFPFVVPSEYFNLYPLDDIPLPRLLPRDGHAHHPWIAALDAYSGQDRHFESDEIRLAAIAAYLGLCSFVDAQIGLVLDALRETGLDKTTRVVYTSDHGDNLGTRGLWGKSVLYEESTRIPMIITGPGIPRGEIRKTPVNLIDLHQTALESAGQAETEEDGELPGRSLIPLAGGDEDPERTTFSEYHAVGSSSAAFMLRRGNWKYHHYVGYPPELFNLEDDPGETSNRADDPDYAEVTAAFEAQLRGMIDPEAVDRLAKDDQAELVKRFGGRDKAATVGTPGATPVPGYTNE